MKTSTSINTGETPTARPAVPYDDSTEKGIKLMIDELIAGTEYRLTAYTCNAAKALAQDGVDPSSIIALYERLVCDYAGELTEHLIFNLKGHAGGLDTYSTFTPGSNYIL